MDGVYLTYYMYCMNGFSDDADSVCVCGLACFTFDCGVGVVDFFLYECECT